MRASRPQKRENAAEIHSYLIPSRCRQGHRHPRPHHWDGSEGLRIEQRAMNSNQPQRSGRADLVIPGLLLAALAGIGWFFFAPSSSELKGPGKEHGLFLYCDHCGLEVPCAPGQEDQVKPCPRCGDKDKVLHVKFFSQTRLGEAPARPLNRRFIGFALGLPVVLALAVVILRRFQAPKQTDQEDSLHTLRCPCCGHSLPYRVSQVGQKTSCPICQQALVFPSPGSTSILSKWKEDLVKWKEEMRRKGKFRGKR